MCAAPYSVSCPCGAVKLAISAKPVGQSWCHCKSCAIFHQTTPVPYAMFKADAVTIEKGKDSVQVVNLAGKNFFGTQLNRNFCKGCGYRLFNEPATEPFRGMPANCVEGLNFEPAFHGFCQDATEENMKRFQDDGLPKWVDQPKDSGGSGKELKK